MKRQVIILWLGFILILGTTLGFCINLKEKPKNVNIIVATAPYNEMVSVYAQPNENSEVISEFCGQTCLTCNLYNENFEIINNFVKVELSQKQIGYVKITDCFCDTLYLNKIQNKNRQKVCWTSLKYLGISYDEMKCTTLIRKSFISIGIDFGDLYVTKYNKDNIGKEVTKKELQPGDIVFYKSIGGKVKYGHIGLYLGQGYVIQSTIDKGKEYPSGGVRITKLTFRSEPTAFRSPFLTR